MVVFVIIFTTVFLTICHQTCFYFLNHYKSEELKCAFVLYNVVYYMIISAVYSLIGYLISERSHENKEKETPYGYSKESE